MDFDSDPITFVLLSLALVFVFTVIGLKEVAIADAFAGGINREALAGGVDVNDVVKRVTSTAFNPNGEK